jgi:pimeloyl-ACP methyl ester carboxylesterase
MPEADRQALRARHVHGDDQIRLLYDMVRSFSKSDDDMAFTAPLLGAITARTLIVHGDRDLLYPVEVAVELFRAIPTPALGVVPNGDHGPIFGEMAPIFESRALAYLAG